MFRKKPTIERIHEKTEKLKKDIISHVHELDTKIKNNPKLQNTIPIWEEKKAVLEAEFDYISGKSNAGSYEEIKINNARYRSGDNPRTVKLEKDGCSIMKLRATLTFAQLQELWNKETVTIKNNGSLSQVMTVQDLVTVQPLNAEMIGRLSQCSREYFQLFSKTNPALSVHRLLKYMDEKDYSAVEKLLKEKKQEKQPIIFHAVNLAGKSEKDSDYVVTPFLYLFLQQKFNMKMWSKFFDVFNNNEKFKEETIKYYERIKDSSPCFKLFNDVMLKHARKQYSNRAAWNAMVKGLKVHPSHWCGFMEFCEGENRMVSDFGIAMREWDKYITSSDSDTSSYGCGNDNNLAFVMSGF